MKLIRKAFCDKTALVKNIPKSLPQNLEHLNPNTKNLTEFEIKDIEKTGASFILPNEECNYLKTSGIIQDFFTNDIDNFRKSKPHGIFYKYIGLLNLFFEYNEVFRDFFQSIARDDFNYLNLVCEAYLANHINSQLGKLRRKGFYIELESLRNKQSFEVVDWKLYKNLRINRYKNYEKGGEIKLHDYGKLLSVATFGSNDISIFDNNKPFILASTMKVTSPMKLSIYNQNLSLKLYGKEEKENVHYLVRFETEMSLGELLSIHPNPNKYSKLRQTKIADINNVLNGNSFINDEIRSQLKI